MVNQQQKQKPVILVTIGHWLIVDVGREQDYYVHKPCYKKALNDDFFRTFPVNNKQMKTSYPNCRYCGYCNYSSTKTDLDKIHKYVNFIWLS